MTHPNGAGHCQHFYAGPSLLTRIALTARRSHLRDSAGSFAPRYIESTSAGVQTAAVPQGTAHGESGNTGDESTKV